MMGVKSESNSFSFVGFLPTFSFFSQPAGLSNPNSLKYVSLLTLTVQNSAVSLCMRYSKTRDGDIFFNSTGELQFRRSSEEIVKLWKFHFSCVHGRSRQTDNVYRSRVVGGRNILAVQSEPPQCNHQKQARHCKANEISPPPRLIKQFSSSSLK